MTVNIIKATKGQYIIHWNITQNSVERYITCNTKFLKLFLT